MNGRYARVKSGRGLGVGWPRTPHPLRAGRTPWSALWGPVADGDPDGVPQAVPGVEPGGAGVRVRAEFLDRVDAQQHHGDERSVPRVAGGLAGEVSGGAPGDARGAGRGPIAAAVVT